MYTFTTIDDLIEAFTSQILIFNIKYKIKVQFINNFINKYNYYSLNGLF